MNQAKPFSISKKIVWEAYERVKANKGAAGVDSESIEAFEQDLKNNLYKMWNRMSSGTYVPPPVRTVAIPKKDGGERRLGIPTVADRIAQTVVKLYLELLVELSFHPDSYGYRPRKSALDAVASAWQRCWRYTWVIDLDIRGFFDNLDHELVLRGGAQVHAVLVDSPLSQAVARSSRPTGGWNTGAANAGHAAGRSGVCPFRGRWTNGALH
jgi:RNA-directed DNA polymerase